MIPKIMPSTITPETLDSNGYGYLGAAHYCRVKQVLNGQYELTLKFPVDDEMFQYLQTRNVIMATADRSGVYQPFRIYRISKPIRGVVEVNARHIVYDLDGIVAFPFTAVDVQTALTGLKDNSANTNPFTFISTRTTAVSFAVRTPCSIWGLMGGQEGSLLDVYGGEYKFDRFNVHFENQIGENNGVTVRYGVNMTDFEQESNCSECYTAVVAYWQNEETVVYGSVVNASGTYNYIKVKTVDLSDKFDEAPTADQLDTAAAAYIAGNNIGVPKVSWKVGFLPLDTTEEYKDLAILERVDLGDTVAVRFEKYGVTNDEARVVEIEWDSLQDRYISVTLGTVKSNIAKTLSEVESGVANAVTTTQVSNIAAQVSNALTSAILGANGGAVRLLDTNNDGMIDELYIADSADPTEAVNVWRFNYQGWGASQNGYNGPFELGATVDGGLLARFVTAANLTAGTIQSADGTTFYLNLDEGILQMGNVYTKDETNAEINRYVRIQNGKLIIGQAGNEIQLEESNNKVAFVDTGTNTEVAYISNERFYAPNLTVEQTADFGGYRMNVSNGIAFKWIGRAD